jgi:hypothetical protein
MLSIKMNKILLNCTTLLIKLSQKNKNLLIKMKSFATLSHNSLEVNIQTTNRLSVEVRLKR